MFLWISILVASKIFKTNMTDRTISPFKTQQLWNKNTTLLPGGRQSSLLLSSLISHKTEFNFVIHEDT